MLPVFCRTKTAARTFRAAPLRVHKQRTELSGLVEGKLNCTRYYVLPKKMATTMATRFIVLSDTHGEQLKHSFTSRVDVAIHCGDITDESMLKEYETAITMLKEIDAPLKLIIAGNHEFTLDNNVFQTHIREFMSRFDSNDQRLLAENRKSLEDTYGNVGDARARLEADDARQAGIVLLDEGIHHFDLENGAHLTVYASPYTASKNEGWGFRYDPDQQDHEWNISEGIDLVMTHSLPRGVLDYTNGRTRAGIPSLFEAIARAKPKVHCFGHIHEAWGAKLVTWREKLSESPSHFTDIDNDKSRLIESRVTLNRGKFDTQDLIDEKEKRRTEYQRKGCREIENVHIQQSEQTLFVNAAIQNIEEGHQQLPWVFEIQLPRQHNLAGANKRQRSPSTNEEEEAACKRKYMQKLE